MMRLPCCSMARGSVMAASFVFSACTLSGRPGLEGGGLAPGPAGPACPCFLAQGPQRHPWTLVVKRQLKL